MKIEIIKRTSVVGLVSYEIEVNGLYVSGSYFSGEESYEKVMKYYDEIKNSITNPRTEIIKSEII